MDIVLNGYIIVNVMIPSSRIYVINPIDVTKRPEFKNQIRIYLKLLIENWLAIILNSMKLVQS